MKPTRLDSAWTLDRALYALVELLVFVGAVVIMAWYLQGKADVVELLEPPQVVSVTREHVEVRWHARLILDCPGQVYPSFVATFGSETLPDYPFVVEHSPKVFTRRYPLPPYLVHLHDVHHGLLPGVTHTELRIRMVAQCNPIWETSQWLRVPFEIPGE